MKQTGMAILAELKELNSRLGRIEQLLQPKGRNFPLKISGDFTPEQLQAQLARELDKLQ